MPKHSRLLYEQRVWEKTFIDAKAKHKDKYDEATHVQFGGHAPESDLTHWNNVYLYGPPDTPYEGGKFKLSVSFPDDFPFSPMTIKFVTKVFHPNVSEAGEICVDILKNTWAPSLTLTKVFISLSSLLADPNSSDPLNSKAGTMHSTNKSLFDKTVKEYVTKYASYTKSAETENVGDDTNEKDDDW